MMTVKFRMPPRAVLQAATYGFSMLVGKLVALAMLPIFTTFLAKEDYGRLEVLQTLANLLSIVCALGLTNVLFRFAGDNPDREGLRAQAANAYGLALFTAMVTLIVGQLAAPAIARALPGDVGIVPTRAILFSLSLTAVIIVPMAWLRLTERALLYFLGSAGQMVLQAILVSMALSASWGLDGVLIAGAVAATAAAVLLGYIQVKETGIALNLRSWLEMSRLGWVIVMAGMASFVIDTFNRWVLAAYVDVGVLAEFAIAAKIGVMAGFLAQPMLMYWLPKVFVVLAEPGGEVRCARMADLGLAIGLISAVAVAAVGPLAVTLLTPPAFHGAAVYIPALSLAYAINSTTLLVHSACLLPKRTVWPMVIEWGAALTAGVCYLVLIPVWHGWGAIAAMLISFSGRFLAYVLIGGRIRVIPYAFGRLAVLFVIASAAMLAIGLAANPVAALAIGGGAALSMTFAAIRLGLVPTALTSWLPAFGNAQPAARPGTA